MAHFETIDDYLASLTPEVATEVQKVRERLAAAAPEADEAIAYNMPTLKLNGKSLVHFAGWKKHLSLYPEPAGDEALQAELAPYATGRGTLQFPYHRPIPAGLLERIVAALAAAL